MATAPEIAAIDLFCGAGGLSLGLLQAGVRVVAGVDLDPRCQYPFEKNIGAKFLLKSVTDTSAEDLVPLWPEGSIRLLAGCAPCQPFSKHRRGEDTTTEPEWGLLGEFARLVRETEPDLVTMENVAGLQSAQVFLDFVIQLSKSYTVDFDVVYGPDHGLAQHRRRLVLVASRLGDVQVPRPSVTRADYLTVEDVIGSVRPLGNGEADPEDAMHHSRHLNELNMQRMLASVPGGTWRDWPEDLRAACHRRASGASFQSAYARMTWNEPAPTITTQSFNFGTGRFGHPSQHRTITLREAAMLQGFPQDYEWVRPGETVQMAPVGRLVGNAVPPPLGRAIGETFAAHVISERGEA